MIDPFELPKSSGDQTESKSANLVHIQDQNFSKKRIEILD